MTHSIFLPITIPDRAPSDGGSWDTIGEKQWEILENMIQSHPRDVRLQFHLANDLYNEVVSKKEIADARKQNCELAIASIGKLQKKHGGSAILIKEREVLEMDGWIHDIESKTMKFDPGQGDSSLSLPDEISLSEADKQVRREYESLKQEYQKCRSERDLILYRRSILHRALNQFENLGFLPEWNSLAKTREKLR